jgi:hypothetical protein
VPGFLRVLLSGTFSGVDPDIDPWIKATTEMLPAVREFASATGMTQPGKANSNLSPR